MNICSAPATVVVQTVYGHTLQATAPLRLGKASQALDVR